MPIYEFKCSRCQEFFESLLIRSDDDQTVKCPECGSTSFERVLSATRYAVGPGGGGETGGSKTTRTCSSGNCTTYEIPGHTR